MQSFLCLPVEFKKKLALDGYGNGLTDVWALMRKFYTILQNL
jgi:hypothetical protein